HHEGHYLVGMNVGPTERIVFLPSGSGVAGASAAGAVPGAGAAARAFLPFCCGGSAICLARASGTPTSPGPLDSPVPPRGSDQLWPAFLQVQAASNAWRYLKAFGSAV